LVAAAVAVPPVTAIRAQATIVAVKLKDIADMPPWDWPSTAADTFKRFLRDHGASQDDRVQAAELAGDMTVVDNEMADVLLGILTDKSEAGELRARAAISLGPVLQQTDEDGFDDPFMDDPPITEETFDRINDTLHAVYGDESAPKEVRRRAFEASVRAAQDWHADAIRAAYVNPDEDWRLTAVFGMQYVQGFEKEILESLKSSNEDIHYEAISAAGGQEVAEAWPHIKALLESSKTPKRLLLAAIGAAPWVNAEAAGAALVDLTSSEDEEIAEAADEAIMEAESAGGLYDDEEDEDDFVN
jgi:hypothetical protein